MLRKRLFAFVPVFFKTVALSVVLGGAYSFVRNGHSLASALQGTLVGLVVCVIVLPVEFIQRSMRASHPLRRVPFLPHLAMKSLLYVLAFTAATRVAGVDESTLDARVDLPAFVIISIVVNMAMAVARMLGPQMLVGFLTGRYYNPALEERVFLFIDLQGSTTIAERIGPLAFHRLLNRFIGDLTDAVLAEKGQIYKYVGDEMIVSWPEAQGILGARCVRACLAARDVLERRADDYERDFGLRPRFRAGMHCGVAVAGEMGVVKQEIAYLGDVVNTTARIQQACRETGHWFLISRTLLDRLRLPPAIAARSVGEVSLRGKTEAIELFAIEPMAQAASDRPHAPTRMPLSATAGEGKDEGEARLPFAPPPG